MAIEVKLPELGDGIESGDVLEVLVQVGDVIRKDQAICELETDKATVEIPSSHSGKVVTVHIASGQSVPIGATLITLEAADVPAGPTGPSAAGSSSTAAASPETPAPPPGPPASPAADAAPVVPVSSASTPSAPTSVPASAVPAPQSAAPAVPNESPSGAASAAAGPAIRRLAREVGIDLSQIHGSGPGGRITRDDVLVAVRRASAATPVAKSAPKSDAGSQPAVSTPTTASTADDWGPIQVERMTKIRKTIAARMHASWVTVPRVTNFDDADVTELERIRKASKADYTARGIKLTSMPFVIKAVALALRHNPILNSSIDEANEQIIYKQYINIGIAVDTDRGLVVPSLRKPDELSIPDIARALVNIADNARNNNFKIEDLRGSTFSISNLGAIGGTYSTPVINLPEVAVLLVGRSRKLPVVVEDKIVPRVMMPLSLSYDHRLVDGAAAARFLNDVIEYLQNPSRLLIAP
jgi:pyruvate/2-oxoglutarate dehydrogenase complex dihydrolipoamide acyltransferase (E2) component